MIVLPKEKVKKETDNPSRIVLYGPPKVGKTTFVAQLDNNLILDLEGGTRTLDALKYRIHDLAEFREVCGAIYKDRGYKYLTIDTATILEEWAEWSATEMYMKSTIGRNFNAGLDRKNWESVLTLANGGGYYWLRQSFMSYINAAAMCADHLIIIAHLKDKSLEKKGIEVMTKDVDLTGKLKNIVCASADAVGYMYRNDDDELRINFKSNDSVICGARPAHLAGADIEADWSKIFIE